MALGVLGRPGGDCHGESFCWWTLWDIFEVGGPLLPSRRQEGRYSGSLPHKFLHTALAFVAYTTLQSARVGHRMKKSYLSIQYLRGLAAMLVVIFHLGVPLERFGYTGGWPVGLSAGVDIFFVISGFVMWLSTYGRPITPVQFYAKRIVRIVPLYWLLTSLMLGILIVAPSAVQTAVLRTSHAIASYLFVPMLNPGKPAMEPLLFPGWTLNYEMFFYAIFGLFLLATPRVRLIGTTTVLVAAVAAGAIAGVPRLSVAGFYSSPVMLEFVAGMLIGALTVHRGADRLLPTWAAILGLTGGLAMLLKNPLPPEWPWALCYGVPAAAIVLGAVSLEGRGHVGEWRLPHLLGDASYSIYLTQLITMAAFRLVWTRVMPTDLPGGMLLFLLLDVMIAAAGGVACYYLLERSLTALFDRRRKTPRPAASVA